jgi:hypothetical protein
MSMSRPLAIGLPALLLAHGALGCERRDPLDPHEFVAEETARIAHASPAAARGEARVTCRCDADAGLHVVAAEGSIVTVPPDAARTDAEADIVVASERDEASEAPGGRLRHTVSLGFVGDGKLTEIPPRGGYHDGGFTYPPTPYYGFGGGVSRRFGGGGVHRGFVGGGSHGSHGGGGGHGGHGGHGGR